MPRPEIAGVCRSCQLTLDQLDRLLDSAVTREIEMDGTSREDATLHALALVGSFWLDRTLAQFPTAAAGAKAARVCLANMFDEQGIGLPRTVLLELADALEATPRTGADRDVPEGARAVRISDTAARAMVQAIRRHTGAEK